MRTFLKGTLIGTVAVTVALFALALAAGVVADASGAGSFTVDLGPLPLFAFERTADATATTFGSGLFVLCVALGACNGLAAVLLQRRFARGAAVA